MSVCLSVVNFVSCQVEISAMDRSLDQRSSTECGVSVYDVKTSIMRRPMTEKGYCAAESRNCNQVAILSAT